MVLYINTTWYSCIALVCTVRSYSSTADEEREGASWEKDAENIKMGRSKVLTLTQEAKEAKDSCKGSRGKMEAKNN